VVLEPSEWPEAGRGPNIVAGRPAVVPKADSPAWLESALAEYNALRNEGVTTLRTALDPHFRYGGHSVLGAGAFIAWDEPAVAAIVFHGVTALLSVRPAAGFLWASGTSPVSL
jgi:hypothetical protein